MQNKLSVLVALTVALVGPACMSARADDDRNEPGPQIGPVWVASNVYFYWNRPHYDHAGPSVRNRTHMNFHIRRSVVRGRLRPYTEVANLHVCRVDEGTRICMNVWDSVSDWERRRCLDPSRLQEDAYRVVRSLAVALGLTGAATLASYVADRAVLFLFFA